MGTGGDKSAQGGDLNGYVWANLEKPVTLLAGKDYFLVSSEGGTDTYFDQKVWMQPHPGLLSGLIRPVSTTTSSDSLGPYPCVPRAQGTSVCQVSKDGSGDWVVGGGGSGGVPLAPDDLHYILSKSTQECWDTRSTTALDLWACVQDGHNELFNYSASTGLITTGPRDAVGGKCVKAVAGTDEQTPFPPTSSIAECDASDDNQLFEHTADGQLRLRHDPSVCMTAVRNTKLRVMRLQHKTQQGGQH